jgi:hypothetical protein
MGMWFGFYLKGVVWVLRGLCLIDGKYEKKVAKTLKRHGHEIFSKLRPKHGHEIFFKIVAKTLKKHGHEIFLN